MPLPPLARNQLHDYFVSFDFFDLPFKRAEGEKYAALHADRIWRTLQYIPPRQGEGPRREGRGRVLELGADPYLMSFTVMRNLGYEITPANFFGDYGEPGCGEYEVTIGNGKFGDEHTFRAHTFNLERDPFPYDDGHFQVCLCCEILEHLVSDPGHMLREIHRVLAPGGTLVLTTPNAARFEVLRRVFWGHSPHPMYSGSNLYERHNREYDADELSRLLRAHNFETVVEQEDVYAHGAWYSRATRLGILKKRRDTLFAVGRKTGVTVHARPAWLYEFPRGKARVTEPRVVMGPGDQDHLGPGWHDAEYWPPSVRWSSREATVHLLPHGVEAHVSVRMQKRPRPITGRVLVNDVPAGDFAVEADTAQEIVFPLPEAARRMRQRGEIPWYDVTIRVDDPFIASRSLAASGRDLELGLPVESIELRD